MRIENVPIKRINAAPYNPRRDLMPGDAEFERLTKSIDEFGLVEPLVWNRRTGNLVGGHQRLKVLAARGEKSVEVVVVDLSLDREKALNLALNKISGEWDEDKLAALLHELVDVPDFDIELTGFDLEEARDLIADVLGDAAAGRAESFDVEGELAKITAPVTKPGDLILLGRDRARQHRLLCGDSADPEQVQRLMKGERAILFATDPPYLVDYDGTNHPGAMKKSRRKKGTRGPSKDWSSTYGCTWDDADGQPELYQRFVRTAVDEAIAPNAAWYCWHASRRQAMLERVWNDAGAFVHAQLIWAKNRAVPTRTWYLWAHEPCLMGWLRGNVPPRRSKKRLPTVWQIPTLANGPERPDHPTPKPLELFEIPMRQHTREGEVCYEPFAGSGTQFIAAERLGRRCFGIEVSPVYCDLIVRRFIAFAGVQSVSRDVARKYGAPKGGGA